MLCCVLYIKKTRDESRLTVYLMPFIPPMVSSGFTCSTLHHFHHFSHLVELFHQLVPPSQFFCTRTFCNSIFYVSHQWLKTLLLSSGVIEWIMASNMFERIILNFNIFLMLFPAPGIIPTRSFMFPIFLICWICSKNRQNQIRFLIFFLIFLLPLRHIALVLFLLRKPRLPFPNTIRHTFWIKTSIASIFTCTDEFNWFIHYRFNGNCRSTTRITI